MSLNESTVEAAALDWLKELGYAVEHGATFAKLRRAKPHHHQSRRTRATLRDPAGAGLPKLLSGELSLPAAMLAAQAGVATTSTTVLASP